MTPLDRFLENYVDFLDRTSQVFHGPEEYEPLLRAMAQLRLELRRLQCKRLSNESRS